MGNGGSDLLLSVFPTTSGPTVFIDADDSAPTVSLLPPHVDSGSRDRDA